MSPTYERLEWVHDFKDEPCVIYSEIDDQRYEMRKIVVFKDGSMVKASLDNPESGSSALADQPFPSLEEVNSYAEFHAQEISAAKFNALWNSLSQ
jgi:hypothetical protein